MKPRRSKPVRQASTARKSVTSPFKGNIAQKQKKSVLPFPPTTPVLLVGEGNLSFAACLATHHKCTQLTATTFDAQAVVDQKYGAIARDNAAGIESAGGSVCYGVDATKLAGKGTGKQGKILRAKRWGAVMFMFPHTGGLTKDVNRQVRANQELLLGFFKNAITLLEDDGVVVVTLFTGPAYDAWNIKDLGKMAGLRVRRSSRFERDEFPGYTHARTLGTVKGNGGAWKGEDREARMWVFEKIDAGRSATKKRKRNTGDEDSSEEDELTPSRRSKSKHEKYQGSSEGDEPAPLKHSESKHGMGQDRFKTEDEDEYDTV